jgi:hypothetical protein
MAGPALLAFDWPAEAHWFGWLHGFLAGVGGCPLVVRAGWLAG